MKIDLIKLTFNGTHSYKYKPFKHCCEGIQNDKAIDSVYANPTAEHDKLIYNNAYAFALEICKACVQNIIEGRKFNDLGEA